ncbi:hypothetical protein B0J13DRAFT_567872 [Dactylonectria estremocensis]|uniref:Uncharacterized protein n=1 Tax=Dactylonectria estremocensis TaxID=1079267 RepID=A0A9P9II39_9HYPO|nr:hypothetical protein B0J13DRAFT_567872 [Dactylonectria estremocensis]
MPPKSSTKPSSDDNREGATSTQSSAPLHKRPLETFEPASELALVKRAKVKRAKVERAKLEPSIEEPSIESDSKPKPRLKLSDLEFDYDRTQLRDQRPTPGRENRPRLEDSDIDFDELKTRFSMPWLDKPKGNGSDEYEDPTYVFHDLHVCHKKGPNGSPTYDNAGYQLDWKKVDKWMKPAGYSKRGAMSGMNRALKVAKDLEELLYSVFFVNGKGPDGADAIHVKGYVLDHMSKDLGIPWHQMKLKKHILAWQKKGFLQQDANTWWRQPNEEEKKRMTKMMTGSILRKDF